MNFTHLYVLRKRGIRKSDAISLSVLEQQVIEQQVLEQNSHRTKSHRTTSHRTNSHRTKQSSNKTVIEQNSHRTNSHRTKQSSNKTVIEEKVLVKTLNSPRMDRCGVIMMQYLKISKIEKKVSIDHTRNCIQT